MVNGEITQELAKQVNTGTILTDDQLQTIKIMVEGEQSRRQKRSPMQQYKDFNTIFNSFLANLKLTPEQKEEVLKANADLHDVLLIDDSAHEYALNKISKALP